jgi:hypothetical protein
MFRFSNTFILSFTSLLIVSSCTQNAKKQEANKSSESWQAKMQELSKVFTELMPLVASPQKFSDIKNKEIIVRDTDSLKRLAHSLKTEKLPKNSDPSLKMTAELFEQDISQAKVALNNNQFESARMILRDTSSYCIQCHTQTNNGPNFPKLNLNFPTEGLSTLETAELYTSLRRFDMALAEFTKLIEDKNYASEHAFEWEQAARSAIAISVKSEKDSGKTLALVKKMAANPSTPAFVKESIQPWEASVQEWRREKKSLLSSPIETLKQVERIIAKAQAHQRYPLDHSQDILYFRASGILHDLLAFHSAKDETKARILYLSGIAAENTRDLNFWTLHETYYELCIQTDPHTDIARLCFDKLYNSMLVGYSGSAGVAIPAEVQTKLTELKSLSAALSNPESTAQPTPKPTPEKDSSK